MKTFWNMVYKKFYIITVLLAVLILMVSCQKNKEQKIDDNFLHDGDRYNINPEGAHGLENTDDIPIIINPRIPGLPYNDYIVTDYWNETLPYNYDGFWSMRFGEYFSLDDKNLGIHNKEKLPSKFKDTEDLYERIDKLEEKYQEVVFNYLKTFFKEDRISDLVVKIRLDDDNLKNVYLKPDACRMIISVNIDGIWKIKFDEKNKCIILPDGSREHIYEPISSSDLRKIEMLIKNFIGSNRIDSLSVTNIPFDRAKQFIDEDTAYFRQKKINAILWFSVITVIITILVRLIFFIKNYKINK